MNDNTVSSSQDDTEGKKRPLSLLEGLLPLEEGTSKKPRELESKFDDRIVKQEDLPSSDLPSLGGGGPSRVISGAIGRSIGFGGDGEEPPLPPDEAVPVAVKSEPGGDEASGIFDDADEDDSFDLATLKKISPPPAPQPSTSLRPDLVAAILGSPPKKFAAPTPFVAAAPEKPEPKRRKFQTKKVLKAKKEMEAASKVLHGKIDLTKVLPEAHCRFLAEKFWIFTVQQLEAVLKATEGTGLNTRKELIVNLMNSDFVGDQVSTRQPSKSSTTDAPTRDLEKEFSEIQTTSVQEESNDHDTNQETNLSENQVLVKMKDTEDSAIQQDPQPSEKSEPNVEVGPEASTTNEEPDSKTTTAAADELIQSWSEMIGNYHPAAQADGLSDFSLDGPISCLVPKCTQNFLKSAGILSAGEFLSLKKTESGLVVDIYASWRKKCGLEEIPCVTIAKHLMGLGTRFEIALDSLVIDKEVREWVGGHAVVLSGQGKDFLFDHCKLYNADVFLERRTKELADTLKDWRDARGLPPLKGTGKVAMISAWKTLIKEAKELELQDGHVLTTADLMAGVEDESSPGAVPTRNVAKPGRTVVESKTGAQQSEIRQPKSSQEPSPGEKPRCPPTQAQLESHEILSEVLKKEIVSLLAASGISTPKQLLEAGKKPDPQLISAVMKMRKDFSGGSGTSDDSTTCIRLIEEWCQQVSEKLNIVDVPAPQTPEKPIVPSRQRATDRASIEKAISDPWDALSQASKDFLMSIDIKDAENFLAAKTKHLADAFAKYREERGMAPLKGLGSVASISGWKAIVRKAAKDAGQDRLVTLNAGRNAGIKLNRRPKEETNESNSTQPQHTSQSMQSESPAKEKPSPTQEGELDAGISKNKFWVTNDSDVFCFDVTQRRSRDKDSKLSWYLSYLGSKSIKAAGSTSTHAFASLPSQENTTTLKVMNDGEGMVGNEALDNRFFKSQDRGLVELSKYGISPRPLNGDLASLKGILKSFILQTSNHSLHDSNMPYNVFERWVNGRKELYFYMACPMEVGQTVELHFLPPIPQSHAGGDCDDWTRICIREEINALNTKDLMDLLDFLNEEIGTIVYQKTRREFDFPISGDVNFDDKNLMETMISRRRMHWSALRIKSALQKEIESSVPATASTPLWSSDLVKLLCKHPTWENVLCPILQSECRKEIMAEIQATPRADFWMTQENWCAMANDLAQQTLEIFSKYNAELDKVFTEQHLIDELCSMVSRAVSHLKQVEGNSPDDVPLSKLLMRVRGHHSSPSDMFPSLSFFRGKLTQAYMDCLAMCDEPLFDVPTNNEQLFIAIVGSASKSKITDFESVENFHATKATIDVPWYVGAQVVAVVETVALSGVANLALADPTKINDISTIIRECAKSALGNADMIPPKFGSHANEKIQKSVVVPEPLLNPTVKPHCKPDSAPIFLVTVWPILKAWKWRMEAASTPSSVVFYSPGRKKDKRTRHLKYEAAMQRLKLARKTAELGLGYIPKQAKRLFINCGAVDENNDDAPTISEALTAFKMCLVDAGTPEVLDGTEKIVESLSTLIENIGPHTLYDEEAKDVELPEGKTWKESLSCEYLMRFLLVLPKMLRHSDLSTQQADTATGVVAELVGFLVDRRKTLFGECLQPPREEYEKPYEFPKFIVPHLETTQANSIDDFLEQEKKAIPSSLKEVVLPSDRLELTDFVTTVLDQLIICRASTDDLRRKGRRAFLALGCPGLMCRHCLGQNGEGKYFYSNIQSLSTAPTSIDKHIARCPKISNEVKEKMAAARATHSEQKASTPSGAQSAFFSRLWDRLQLSRTFAGAEGDMYVSFNDVSGDGEQEKESHQTSAASQSGVEFRSHIDILTYIQTSAPWKNNVEVLNALEKYHSCLKFGGAIFNTPSMPPHYSSEWVLAKHYKGRIVSEQAGATS